MQVGYNAHVSSIISLMVFGGTFMLTIHQICEKSVSKLEN